MVIGTVYQYAQYLEKFWHCLNLIQNDKTCEAAQHQFWILQPAPVWKGLNIEECGLLLLSQLARQGGLSTLAGT